MSRSKIWSSHLLSGLALLVSSASHAQVAPPQTVTPNAALFPRQTELFGTTIKVEEAGFAPASRLTPMLDSSPRFFIRWSVPGRPYISGVKFVGLVNPPGQEQKTGRIEGQAAGTSVIYHVTPTAKSYLACFEVNDPKSTLEDNGTFLKTYEFTAPAPTKEKNVVNLEQTITTEHGTQLRLKKVEAVYDGPIPLTRVTFRADREMDPNPLSPKNNVSISAGLESISDGVGAPVKPFLINPDAFMQSLRGDVTYIVETLPDPKSKELRLKLSVSESSPSFRKETSSKRAYIEIPVAPLYTEAALKPTAIEAAPSIQSQNDDLDARLDVKGDDGQWRGVLWLSPKAKENAANSTTRFSIGSITSSLSNGNTPAVNSSSTETPMGHNDGTLARDNELAFDVSLSPGEELTDKGSLSVVVERSDFQEKPVKFETLPLPGAGKIVDIPEANRVPQETIGVLRVAVLDEALRAQIAKNTNGLALDVPLGSIVAVASKSNNGSTFSPTAISVGADKQKTEMKLLLEGDPFKSEEEMYGSFQTFIFSTPNPLPVTTTFTLEGLTSRLVKSQQLAPIEFKDVPMKFPGT